MWADHLKGQTVERCNVASLTGKEPDEELKLS